MENAPTVFTDVARWIVNGHPAGMNAMQKPTIRQCLICQLPQKRLTQVNVDLIVNDKPPLELSRELGVTVKAVLDHIEHCLDMPVYAGRVVQLSKQRLEIDPEQVITRLMTNLDKVDENATMLESQSEYDKAGRLRLGLAQQLAKFIETVMERAERVQLSKQLDEAMNAPVRPQDSLRASSGRTAAEVLRELSVEALREG